MSLFKRPGLQWFAFWWVLGWSWVGLVWYLSLTSSPLDIDMGTSFNDKIGHITAYTWLMFWFGNLYTRRRTRTGYAIIFILMGILLEVLQGSLIANREFSYGDMLANTLGVVIGYLLVLSESGHILKRVEAIILKTP